MLIVRKVTEGKDLEQTLHIRKEVFVEEQHVPEELECDEFDKTSSHFLATVDGAPCGAARWRATTEGVKLERFAVLKRYRGKGVGSGLVEAVLKDIRSSGVDAQRIYLHAQLAAVFLYEKYGFLKEGPEFEEAGIRHYKMFLPNPE